MKSLSYIIPIFFMFSCGEKEKYTTPIESSITSSVYASGNVKSKNQYSVYPKTNGVINHIYVTSGDSVKKGSPLFTIMGVNQELNEQNAELVASYYNFGSNTESINDAKQTILLSSKKKQTDSLFYYKNKRLFNQNLISELEYSQSELAYENSKTAHTSAKLKYESLLKQIQFNSKQAKKSLEIAKSGSKDLTVFSEIDGIVYNVTRNKGESVSIQNEIAIIGNANDYILEMQVDENEIIKIKKGQKVIVTLDSYPDSTFVAFVTKINPYMDNKTRTFLIEGQFKVGPKSLFPNINFEANIIIEEKENVLLIPRELIINESSVILKGNDTVKVEIGLKDFNYAEIISGIDKSSQLINPLKQL